jgi:hypothetical protein
MKAPCVKPLVNQYFVCIRHNGKVVPWDLTGSDRPPYPECVYFGKALQEMEQHLQVQGLTFYLTANTRELPTYGEDVVAIILGDEACTIPAYVDKVRAIFKCYGTTLTLGCNPFLKPNYLNFLTFSHYLKNWLSNLPNSTKYTLKSIQKQSLAPIYDIPLGYFNQIDLPIKPIQERQYDVFFAGSVVHETYPKRSLKYWLGTPKSLARQRMLDNMNALKQKYPHWQIESLVTANFQATKNASAQSYSEQMMAAKICLVPRGASYETFRFFEGLRYGCVVICEALPSRWFYDGSPAIRLEDWRDLEQVVKPLLEDDRLLQEKHQQSLDWWRTQCSETVLGKYIAEKLNLISSPSSSHS